MTSAEPEVLRAVDCQLLGAARFSFRMLSNKNPLLLNSDPWRLASGLSFLTFAF
jgi:hypothetical protein